MGMKRNYGKPETEKEPDFQGTSCLPVLYRVQMLKPH